MVMLACNPIAWETEIDIEFEAIPGYKTHSVKKKKKLGGKRITNKTKQNKMEDIS